MSTPSPAVLAARARTYDELYTCARGIARRMVVFAFLGLLAAGLMLLGAFLIVQALGEKGRIVAMPIAIAALAVGACSFFLRRAADRYHDAHQERNVAALVDGVAFETAYWRTSAICALVMAAAIVVPMLVAKVARQLAPNSELRTVNDMRVIGTALEKYATQHHAYPNAKSLDVLATVLRPHLEAEMPRVDGWKRPFEYQALCRKGLCDDYRLVSLGANGVKDVRIERIGHVPHYYTCDPCPVALHDLEIVHGGGRFLLMPPALRQPND